MASISALSARFSKDERPIGIVIDPETVLRQALAATRMYAGYGVLECGNTGAEITADTDLSDSEWAVIRPLFLLYVERECAIHQEASRAMGLETFGRMSSEISGDIALAEQNLPGQAFCYTVITV
ncbi:hypothetical protein F6R98_10615 [Candidatus Methylospira mobilis]|uniref:Uncharacterized protein n=1 Tax=Candidatus Methylospira mobilis TaxID=1808979 RepID=A0A5Q0BKN0_9GAMM|nr:hypothetical protein [Candidatus Methylospira mobilis]QFY42764.1 hypothetical protein F6R98_09120 [Candidatus Methylospira mobilis]QFY43011.1 hypothetical protein F6R98_10615 [Candidatus Methylospira mobilis]